MLRLIIFSTICTFEVTSNGYVDCGKVFGCYGYPEGCVDNQNCTILSTFQQDKKTGNVDFQLFAKVKDRSYVAVGLNEKEQMANASVMACYVNSNTMPRVSMAWNFQGTAKFLDHPYKDLLNTSISYQSGLLTCKFTRPKLTTIVIPGTKLNKTFDLTKGYYLLLAQGPVKLNSTGNVTGLNYHNKDRIVSKKVIQFGVGHNTKIEPKLPDGHGCFGFPKGCDGKNCTMIACYEEDAVSNNVTFTLHGRVDDGSYLALGLNNMKQMANASVVACFYGSQSLPKYGAAMAWNLRGDNKFLANPYNSGIEVTLIRWENGFLTCKFMRPRVTTFTIPDTKENVTFNLADDYYLLLARGQLDVVNGTVKGLHYHYDARIISDDKVAFEGNGTVIPYDDCSSDGCFGFPHKCLEKKNCSILATYKQDASSGDVDFGLYGDANDGSYIAVGINGIRHMFNASVIACFYSSKAKKQFGVPMAWNVKGSSKFLDNPYSGGIKVTSITWNNGKLACKFTRPRMTNVTIPGTNDTVTFDLTKDYYFLLAGGDVIVNQSSVTGLQYHHAKRIITYDKVKFGGIVPVPLYHKCNHRTYGCFGYPDQCVERKGCKILVVFQRNATGNGVNFELYGEAKADTYLAIGLNNVRQMANASVVACFYGNRALPKYGVPMAWNFQGNAKFVDNPYNNDIKVSLVSWEDGLLGCQFTRPSLTNVTIPGTNDTVTFDLSKNYYLLLAGGDLIVSSNRSVNGLKYHKKERILTKNKVSFDGYNPIPYNKCVQGSGCFALPDKSCIRKQCCDILATYFQDSSGDVTFGLYGKIEDGSYLAIGLNDKHQMSNASVVACFYGSKSLPMMDAASAWNFQGENKFLEHPYKTDIKLISIGYDDGLLACKFKTPKKTDIHVPGLNETVTFDLSNKYYLLLASGELATKDSGNQTVVSGLTYHHSQRVLSKSKIGFKQHQPTPYDDCGKGHGCFGLPKKCIKTKNCHILMTYTQKLKSGNVAFGLYGQVADKHYLAAGLNNEYQMKDASVMACFYDSLAKSKSNVAMGWNFDGDSKFLDNPYADLEVSAISYVDGFLSCAFTRAKVTRIKVPGTNVTHEFDLAKPYYLLLALGPAKTEGTPDQVVGITLHDQRGITDKKIYLNNTAINYNSVTSFQTHGILMVVAWCLTLPIGMLISGLFKQWFPFGLRLLNREIWFLSHFFLMILTLLLHMAGLIVIVYHSGIKPVQEWKSGNNPHVILGIITTSLLVVQLLVAFSRPKPQSEKRQIYNYFHIGNATVIQILAGITLVLATLLPAASLPHWAVYVAIMNGLIAGFIRALVFWQRRYTRHWREGRGRCYQKIYIGLATAILLTTFVGFGLFIIVIMQMQG